MYTAPDRVNDPLYVITAQFNPVRFKSRWKHYDRFAQYVQDSGAILYTVEAAWGKRQHALEERAPIHVPDEERTRGRGNRHRYVRVRTNSEMWVKENLLNIGISRLPPDWKYVAWVDADVAFARPNWVGETIQQLQHYKVVQMWSEAYDLGPRYASIQRHRSFMWSYFHNIPMGGKALESVNKGEPPRKGLFGKLLGSGGYYGEPSDDGYDIGGKVIHWHPGYAWAARREVFTNQGIGQLIDWAILGAGDNHMAHALIGNVEHTIHPKIHRGYALKLLQWQELAERYIRRNVGYVSGTLLHYWHGRKVDRKYWDRWKILVDSQFDPYRDLIYDAQGVLQLVDHGDERSHQLRDRIMAYFRARNEDSIELSGKADEE